MAEALDQMLEPGEEVLCRDGRRRRRETSDYRNGAALLLAVGGLCLALGFRRLDHPIWLAIGLGCCGLAAIFLLIWRRGRRRLQHHEAVITKTRVLYRTEATAPDTGEIPLAEVAGVEPLGITEDGVRIVMRDGTAVELPDLEDAYRFAGSVLVAAGLAPPRASHRLDVMDLGCMIIAVPGAVLCGAILLLSEVLVAGTSPGDRMLVWAATGALAAAVFWIGLHLARLLVFLRNWRDHSPDEVGAWLCPRPHDTLGERWSRRLLWMNPLYQRLAGALYGEPVRAEEEAGHG